MSEESLNPELDELWAKHDGLTPKCCAEMIALVCKLEQERNVWKHEADVVRKQLESEHETAIDWFIAYQTLKQAVAETLQDCCHLADGEQCTLKKLKDAYAKAKSAEAGLDSENEKSQDAGATEMKPCQKCPTPAACKAHEQCLMPGEAALPPTTCSAFWGLFEHMSQSHGLTLLDSELADICHAVDRMRETRQRRATYSRAELADKLKDWMIELWGDSPKNLDPEQRDQWHRDNGLIYHFICDHFPAVRHDAVT